MWLVAYGIFLHVYYSHLQLVCLGVFLLKIWLLFVAQAGKMTIFVTGLSLELPGRTLETFYMLGVTTLWTSMSSFVCLAWIKFLKGWSLILVFIGVPILTLWSLLVGMLFLLGLAWWEASPLMPHEINLICLGSFATPLMCLAADFEDSIFLASCLTLLAGNFSRSILESFMALERNSSSFRKKQNISLCKILAVSGGCLARDTSAWTALYHSSTDLFPCLKLVSRSNLALDILGLWKLDPRQLPSRYNKIKHYIFVTSWRQACETAKYCDDTINTGFHMGRVCKLYSSIAGLWKLDSQATST